MSYLKISLVLIISSLSFFLFSCSEDNTTSNNSNGDFFPTSKGSYWKFLSYDLDSNSVRVPETEDTIITTIVGTTTIAGKNAIIFAETSSKNKSTDTIYLAEENNKIFTFLSLFNNDFIPINSNDQWVMIADFNLSSGNQWTILNDTTLETFDIPPDLGFSGTMTPTISIKGRKEGNSIISVKGKNVQAQEFIITFVMKIKVQISGVPLPVNLDFNVVTHTWYGENIGQIRSQTDPFSINIVVQKINFNGSRSELLDYYIK